MSDCCRLFPIVFDGIKGKNKDYKKSDEIRDKLLNMGIVIKDVPGGKTEWRLK